MINPHVKHHFLDNGLKIIVAKDKSNPIISLQLYVKVGSVHEKSNESGYSHLMEHLVFKSTQNYPDNKIMEKASSLGANINAYTEYDSTCHYLTLPSKYLENGLELLSELAMRANFSDEEFTTEKKVVIEELKQYANDPEEDFVEKIPQFYFQESPYHNPIIGHLDNLESSTPDDLRAFYQKYYKANNCFLVISGDFKFNSIKSIVEKYFASWLPNDNLEFESCPNIYQTGFSTHTVVNEDLNQEILAFVIPEISEKTKDGLALSLITKGFAIGKNSRLYKRLYIKEQLVTSIQVQSISGHYDGLSIILIVPKSNTCLEDICRIFIEEYNSMRIQGLTYEELRKIKVEQEHSWKYAFEYVENFASVLGVEELDSGYEGILRYPVRLASLDIQHLLDVANKFYKLDNLKIIHLGTKNHFLDKLEKDIKSSQNEVLTSNENNNYMEYTTSNGMKIIMKKVLGKPTVGISLTRKISQLCEPVELRGINFFTLALMQFGTKKYSYEELVDYCKQRGINLNVHNGIETSGFKVKCFGEYISEGLQLIADLIREPQFPIHHLHNIKQSVRSNLRRIHDFPTKDAVKKFNQFLFGRNSNLINKTGELSDVTKITRKRINSWHKEFLDLSQMSLVVIGDIHFDNIIRTVENTFNFTSYHSQVEEKVIYTPPSKKRHIFDYDNDQSIIHIGGFACNANDYRLNVAFHVLSQIIGGEISSRLFNELREKLGLAYSVGFDFTALSEVGFFANYAIVDRNREEQAIASMKKIMKDIIKNNVTKEEMELTKNFINGQRLLDDESVASQASSLGILSSLGYSYDFYLNREKRLQEVSFDDIAQIAETYFTSNNLYTQIYR
jgi:zinc protease